MNTILLQKAKGSKIDHNSMYEKDLSSPIDIRDLYSSPANDPSHRNDMEVPDYLDHGIDITENPLYKYLNNY